MVGGSKEERNKNSVKVSAHLEYYRLTPGALHQVHSCSACVCVSSCVILMSEGLVKSMWTGLPPGVDGTPEAPSGGVLGPGDGGDNLREELDEESE